LANFIFLYIVEALVDGRPSLIAAYFGSIGQAAHDDLGVGLSFLIMANKFVDLSLT
jgi:hypothetical protein